MKIAAAEAQWTTCGPCWSRCSRSAATTSRRARPGLAIPRLLPLLATDHGDSKVAEVWLIVAGAAMFAAYSVFRRRGLLAAGRRGNVPGPGQPAPNGGKTVQ